ncbi:hypothetical protein BC826DRAFT_959021 [Russula brevipes]|nr:hypothetical protein BC826DRAFT_959021 [Russula brevipes]
MIPQSPQLAGHAISARDSGNMPSGTARRGKRFHPDMGDHTPGHDAKEYVVASTSVLVAAPATKRAKRAETRICPVCGEDIPLRLLGQHYTLESSRVQTILDHVGDLEGFSDPHASAHVPSMARRRAAANARDPSAVFTMRLEKTLCSIRRRRKTRNMALRAVTRDEDDVPVTGKGKGRANATAEQCPVCMQDVEGDTDVIAAHVDACLAHAELHRPGGSIDTDAHGHALQKLDEHVDEGSDELPGATAGAAALGFVVGDRTIENVDEEIDVEGDDLSAFGAAQFTETEALTEDGASGSPVHSASRQGAEVEVDLAIEHARHGKDSVALIAALENKVRLLSRNLADGTTFGCRICLEVYSEPTASIGCWHVCCKACWLRCLNATGVCPICKRITVRGDLRRVFL